MLKLTGHGRPTVYTEGMLGQHYKDLDTGNVYECRRSSKYSPTHGAPVGGYIWELRATGEDIREHHDIIGDKFFEVSEWINEVTWDGAIGNNAKFVQEGTIWNGPIKLGTTTMTYYKVSDAIPDISAFTENDFTIVKVSDTGKVTETNFTANDNVTEYDGYYMLAADMVVAYKAGCTFLSHDGPKIPEPGIYLYHSHMSMPMANYEETIHIQKVYSPAFHLEPIYKIKEEHLPMLDPIYGEVYDQSFAFDGEGRMEPDIVETYGSGGYAYGWFKICNLEDLGELTDDTEFRVEFSGSFAEQYGHQPVTYKFGDRALYDWWENDTTSMKLEKLLFIYEQVVDRFDHVAEPGLYGYTSISAWDNELIGSEYVSKVCIGKPDIKVVDHKIKESYIPESVTPFVIHINGELPSPDFTGEVSEYTWTIDKTIQEIVDTINAERFVTAISRVPRNPPDYVEGANKTEDYICLSVLINPYHDTVNDKWEILFYDYYNSYCWVYSNYNGSDHFYYDS